MPATVINNRIPSDMPDEDLLAIQGALQLLEDKLMHRLTELGPDARRGLLKMGSKSVDFVAKTLSYARNNPQFLPSLVDMGAFTRGLATIEMLREFQQPVVKLADMLNDTLLITGSEAFTTALTCYHSFQAAEKVNAPGAGVIVKDLSTRYPGRTPVRAKPVAPSEPAA
jgi:hypothetical protein